MEPIKKPPALARFERALYLREKSKNTREKYVRDAGAFLAFLRGGEITKDKVIAFKNALTGRGYAVRSVNSMLAGVNAFLSFIGLEDCRVRTVRAQTPLYCREEKELTREEYRRLVQTARKRDNLRLALLLETLCGTGIRVSELPFITAEAARAGEAAVLCKGKSRNVFLVRALRGKLLAYAREQGIRSGPLFLTRSGRPMDRIAVWREMKALCREADVSPSKVFPHNLRHLFARVFYALEKDLAKLADVLGHSSVNTTRLYIISTGEEHRRRMERMRLIL
ncbi:MAG: tyrosine-type recombinase/integrase [Clostridia bacterium]|nr:tyrosine-type recombinase/integrase [Clostridia bacterium]